VFVGRWGRAQVGDSELEYLSYRLQRLVPEVLGCWGAEVLGKRGEVII
jgi:hypothetical protein